MTKTTYLALAILLVTTASAHAETIAKTTETVTTTVVAKTEKPVVEKNLSKELTEIKNGWAVAKYKTEGKEAQLAALGKLEQQSFALTEKYPTNADAKVWYAAILSTEASIIEGLSALPKVKEAKKQLEAAIAIDSSVEQGYGHTSLGALYGRVPGWPIAFGDKNKAEQHFKKALTLDPASIDANFYYGDFLIRQKDYAAAIPVLEKAVKAPNRAGRKIADDGRRAEAKKLLEEAQENVNKTRKSSYN